MLDRIPQTSRDCGNLRMGVSSSADASKLSWHKRTSADTSEAAKVVDVAKNAAVFNNEDEHLKN